MTPLKKTTLSLLMAGTLLSLPPQSQTAMAQAMNVAYPQTGWTVNPVESNASGGQPFCAMARQFQNNFMMTVARNAQQESSLGMDFLGMRFDTGRNYAVQLDSGVGQSRSYAVKPVSHTAFVIRVGEDAAFFNALNQSGQLTVSIDGQQFRFDMNDLNAGIQKLDQCLYNNVVPAAGNETVKTQAVQAVQPDQNALNHMNAKMTELQDTVRELENRNRALQNSLTVERSRQPEIPVIPAPSPDLSVISSLEAQVSRLNQERTSLQAQLASANANAMAASQPQVPMIDENLLQEMRAQIGGLQQQNATLEAQNMTLTGQKAELERQLTAKQAEFSALNDKAISLQQDNRLLQARLDDLSVQNTTASSNAQNFNAEKQALMQTIAQLEADKKDMAAQLETLRNQNSEAAALSVNASLNDAEMQGLIAENRRLRTEIDSYNLRLAKIQDMEATIERLREDNQNLVSGATSPENSGEDLYETIAVLKRDNAALRRWLDQQKPSDTHDTVMQEQVMKLEQQNRDLQDQLSRKITTIESLKSQPSAMTSIMPDTNIVSNNPETLSRVAKNANDISTFAGDEAEIVAPPVQKAAPSIPVHTVAVSAAEAAPMHLAKEMEMREKQQKANFTQNAPSPNVAPVESVQSVIEAQNIPASKIAAVPDEKTIEDGAETIIFNSPRHIPGYSSTESVAKAVMAPKPDAENIVSPLTTPAGDKVQRLVESLDLDLVQPVRPLRNASAAGNGVQIFEWRTDSLYGTAENRLLSRETDFDQAAQDYLYRMEQRCTGDFAILPGQMRFEGNVRVDTYEIACLGAGVDASAAIVFFGEGLDFSVIAHETGTETIDAAMDLRDQIAQTISSS